MGKGSLIATAWNRRNIFSCILTYLPTHLSVYLVIQQEKQNQNQTQPQLLHHSPFPKLWVGAISRYRKRLLLLEATQAAGSHPARVAAALKRGWRQSPALLADPHFTAEAHARCSRQLCILYGTVPPATEGWEDAGPSGALHIWVESSIGAKLSSALQQRSLWNCALTAEQWTGFAATQLPPDQQPAAGNMLYSCVGEEWWF